jgi:uncharacterized protein (TIGR03083 family)
MPTIVDRDATIALLASTWGAIAELYDGFDESDYLRPTCLPGWTVKDQLSHLIGTEEMLAGVPAPEVDVSHLAHLRNDIARSNEVWIEARRPLPGREVLAEFRAVTARRLATLEAMTQADFDAPSWTPAGPDETFGRFMRIRAYDSFLHEHDARAAVGAADREDPAAVRSALDETAAALGYLVGRRAAMPDGSRVRIELTGAVPATFLIEVVGRAKVVGAFDRDATVGIAMPTMLFLRLTGGRLDAIPHLGTDITLSGDAALAEQLATHLGYTI